MMADMSRDNDPPVELRHVVVVGGSLADWNEFGEAAWRDRIIEFSKVVEHAGHNDLLETGETELLAAMRAARERGNPAN